VRLPTPEVMSDDGVRVGLLGTDVAETVQDAFHSVGGSDEAQGWDNQLSDGGEPTLQYRVSRQQILDAGQTGGGMNYDWRYDLSGALGYVTDVSLGTSLRWGRLSSRWWAFDPAYGEYVDLSGPIEGSADPNEWFVWVGTKVRLRAYNALLEGQFRDSEVTFNRSELRVLIGEVGAGVTADLFDTDFTGSFELRARSREIKDADGEDPIFGRVVISRSF